MKSGDQGATQTAAEVLSGRSKKGRLARQNLLYR
jgi:hypothetical protein